jgi:hypothetical protein
MKLEIENPNRIVESAFYTENSYSFSLFINTFERWVKYDTQGSDENSIEFYYHNDENEEQPDIVRVVFETDAEKEIISRLNFELHSKEQLWILFPVEDVYS